MATIKHSFLSEFYCDKNGNILKYAKFVVVIGTCILVTLYVLSYYYYSEFVSYLLDLTTGLSLLFIVYVAAFIILLDIQVDIDKSTYDEWKKEFVMPIPFNYKMTRVWGCVLIVLGIAAIYFSNRYSNQYAFECSTFVVDKNSNIYHLEWNVDCETAEKAEELVEMKGYQMRDSYALCEECEECAEDVEDEARIRYSR